MRKATSLSTIWVSTRRISFLPPVSPKRRFPAPSTTGVDLEPQLVNEVVLHQLVDEVEASPDNNFPVYSCFSFETTFSALPFSTVELFQSGCSRVDDTTYLGRLFNLSAKSPLRDGHRAASHS